ncbi:MAG: molybdenum cofactor biosynthesis protein MoaA [Thermoprotei archaeon]|nr:MAG: molybdenum cofactor biosynthesis protein MoaA [Thermoprotei archaeon]RLF25946.1 MAG: molybdenum cofactor biosynthesis protein MoaA [Thermoprotei archaeon]
MSRLFDPLRKAREVESIVTRQGEEGQERKYYRFRGGSWYGGIATADCVGCCLRCVFCWSYYPREHPDTCGTFYSPSEVARRLLAIAKRRGYNKVRISGSEPTIGKEHLLKVFEYVSVEKVLFILETNGILIGYDRDYARALSRFDNIHVRVSIKGCTPDEFSRLTGAVPEAFELQLKALENLLDAGVSCHPAVMLSFSDRDSIAYLVQKLSEIEPTLVNNIEEEYVILYPHVARRLKQAGIWPRTYCSLR